jgi:uncharacterized RmlC-like cupin family protein
MLQSISNPFARIVDLDNLVTINVMGPTIQFLTEPGDGDESSCVMRGTIPPDVIVPLHSHADTETFIALSGELEGLVASNDRKDWVCIRPGDVFHVPGGVPHAFRNWSKEPAVSIIASTSRIGRFFLEAGTPLDTKGDPEGVPSAGMPRNFFEIADRYGYWIATPEENARVGLSLERLFAPQR